MGIELNWEFYKKLQLITSFEGDLIYTQYTRLHDSTNSTSPNDIWGITNTNTNLGELRAHIDLELGLKLGTHTKDERYYFDIAATYGFQAFFDQNVFYSYYGGESRRKGLSTVGNLYIQGLTAAFDIHF
jgi:hypothetical protein